MTEVESTTTSHTTEPITLFLGKDLEYWKEINVWLEEIGEQKVIMLTTLMDMQRAYLIQEEIVNKQFHCLVDALQNLIQSS